MQSTTCSNNRQRLIYIDAGTVEDKICRILQIISYPIDFPYRVNI